MSAKISPRLKQIVEALPLQPGMRVLEIGCGPGAAAREIVNTYDDIYVLAIDRSEKAIEQAIKNSPNEIKTGRLQYQQTAIEDFTLKPEEPLFDLVFAVRVGALDGRHPKTGEIAFPRIAKALVKEGKLFIDGGNPLREVPLEQFR